MQQSSYHEIALTAQALSHVGPDVTAAITVPVVAAVLKALEINATRNLVIRGQCILPLIGGGRTESLSVKTRKAKGYVEGLNM